MKVAGPALTPLLLEAEQQVTHNRLQSAQLRTAGRGLPRTIVQAVERAMRSLLVKPRRRRGRFIVVTGVDKAGKETQCFNPERQPGVTGIADWLRRQGYRVLRVYQPSYRTLLGRLVGAHLAQARGVNIEPGLHKEEAWLLWSLDRAQHNARISSWLAAGHRRVVVAKRWTESNVVYKLAEGVDAARVLAMERRMVRPDYVFVLDLSVGEVTRRLQAEGAQGDLYERSAFLERVRRLYLELSQHYPYGRTFLVDAARSAKLVNADLLRTLGELSFA